VAARSIAAGALNGRRVADLARELGVSERHLRRALDRELGVSPNALAQTHRLLLAKRLLTDTPLPVTRVAFASGFQSVRRFNAAFRARYRLKPSALRRKEAPQRLAIGGVSCDGVRLTLTYRPPFAWDALLTLLERDALPGAELVQGRSYARTIGIDGVNGVVSASDTGAGHLTVDVSSALVPVLMPLLATLRRLFDLDAEPSVVDTHLARAGLSTLVARRPGLRIPGAATGFEAVLRELLRGAAAKRVVQSLGEPSDAGVPGLTRLAPSAARIAEAGPARLAALGVPRRRAAILVQIARACCENQLRLIPGVDCAAARATLLEIEGVDDRLATVILMHALSWPDAFPPTDRVLQRSVGAPDARSLEAQAEEWRPWRAYAALHHFLTLAT
jgi:AraC family transcriptional regulator of adaptative response / DNA-3-methyladenine glycosylase II